MRARAHQWKDITASAWSAQKAADHLLRQSVPFKGAFTRATSLVTKASDC